MIENITSSKQYLYHYTKACTALDYIVANHTLQLGSYTGTNDPKESKIWEFNLGINEERDLGKYKMSELSEWLSMALKGKTKLACFSMDSDGLSGNHMQDIFKRGFCKPRMWAQYASGHTGVCLVFDRQKLEALINRAYSKDKLVLNGVITYKNRNIVPDLYHPDDQQYMINIDYLETVGRDAYVEAHLRTHYKRLFFEKMEDWKDESEWRCVVFSQNDENLYLNFEDSMVGIMFGENTEEKFVQYIMDATESWGLRYMGLKWKNCSPWYDYGNLRYIPGIKNSPWGETIKRV
jgi:hypothetical protein